MKCKKCNAKNIAQANFCKSCGNSFSEEERKAAKRFTVVWFLESIDTLKKMWKFKFITDSLPFKIISLLVVFGGGLWMCLSTGVSFAPKESPNYELLHNSNAKEYYLFVDADETDLALFIPNKTESLTMKKCEFDGEVVEDRVIDISKGIKIETKRDESYIFTATYGNDEQEEIKILVYREEGEK